jgi:membrane protein DedA with SNARE-associated domain/rhodanese-related sulfurtransferase
MTTAIDLLQRYGLAVVFANVLLAQLGIPLPAYPVLMITGALSARGEYSPTALLLTSVAASLVADLTWYATARRFGGRVLKTVCRLSLSPDSCVRQTESIFARWGVRSLAVAKFIPGFGLVATVIAAELRVPLARFLVFDAIGATLWSGVGLALGYLFHDAVTRALEALARLGRIGMAVALAGFALFALYRWHRRRMFLRELRMARITVHALRSLHESGAQPVVLDVRSAASRERDGFIPGSTAWSVDEGRGDRLDVPRDREVIVYCACPNEASAAVVAKRLKRAGFERVRPLHGGIDAWVAAGLPLQRSAGPEVATGVEVG